MAVTTTTRLGVTRWSSGGDAFTRDQLDQSHSALETKAAGFLKGTTAGRPTAGSDNDRFFYLDTDTGYLYYSNGSSWVGPLNQFAAPVAVTPGDTQSAGAATTYARSDHRHAAPSYGVVGEIASVATAAAAGVLSKFARADHVHILADGAVTAGKIATGGVSASGQIANGIIVSSHFAPGAVSGAAISDDQKPPTGSVIMYTGTTAPTGWAFCDGTSYTTSGQANLFAIIGYKYGGSGANFNVPDFRTRVPRGAATPATGSTLGVTGGADSVTLVTANLPGHTHGVSAIVVASAGSHSHAASGNTSTADTNHYHSYSGTTDTQGNHNHGIVDDTGTYKFAVAVFASLYGMPPAAGGYALIDHTNHSRTTTNGAHAHNYSGLTGYQSALFGNYQHNHSCSGSTDTQGSHTHALSGTTDSTGSASAIDNRDKFLTINYIIKL